MASDTRTRRHGRARGFTLNELLASVAIIGVLGALLLPVLGRSRDAARSAVCCGNLRQMQAAYVLYLADHRGEFFPWMERLPDQSKLYYFGRDTGGGAEGSRTIDMSMARLAPYLGNGNTVEVCPALPYRAAYFKQKYDMATYGYGINVFLLSDSMQCREAGISQYGAITRPAETIAWADAAQINTFQAPASPSHPMLEEWYYLDAATPPKWHFRHGGHLNAMFADGSAQAMPPDHLDPRCDGQVGYLEAAGKDYYLMTKK